MNPYTQADQEATHIPHTTHKDSSNGSHNQKGYVIEKPAKTARSRNYEIEINSNNQSAEASKRLDKTITFEHLMSPVSMVKNIQPKAPREDVSKRKMLGLRLKKVAGGGRDLLVDHSAVVRSSPQRILSSRNEGKRFKTSLKKSSRSRSPKEKRLNLPMEKHLSPMGVLNTSLSPKGVQKYFSVY